MGLVCITDHEALIIQRWLWHVLQVDPCILQSCSGSPSKNLAKAGNSIAVHGALVSLVEDFYRTFEHVRFASGWRDSLD